MTARAMWLTAILCACVGVSANAAVPLIAAGDGHDTVPVYVDRHGPYQFILDSGADGSAVYEWFARTAHLPKDEGGAVELSGQTGSAKVTMYHVGDFELEGHHLRNVSAYGLPNRHDAGREAGVLGNDFMDGAVVVYDFPCRQVEVHAKPVNVARIAGDGAVPVQAGIDEGTTLLTLPVSVNGAAGVAILDTGSRGSRLTPSFASAAGIDASSSRFRDGAPIFGANSRKMIPRDGTIGTIRFGGVEIEHVNAQVIDLPVLKDDFKGKPAMLLGVDLIGRFRVIYDHSARKIWFHPSQCKLAR